MSFAAGLDSASTVAGPLPLLSLAVRIASHVLSAGVCLSGLPCVGLL
ncbi:hypothetical protein Deval_0031 [Nitratidesulfovibrio vulgaris RCH1]|nr:hypothetical protein Deval_0031 [Nitratidesulfovibrio vulgaris RCH1]